MTWGSDYHNESMQAQTGMLPQIAPSPGAVAARADFEAQQRPAAQGDWFQATAQPPVRHGQPRAGHGGRKADPVGLAVLLIIGVAAYAVSEMPVDPVVKALTLAAPLLLPAALGTLLFGPRWPLGAMLAGFVGRVVRTVLALFTLGLTLLAGAAAFLATLYLAQSAPLSLGALRAGTAPEGWALAWLCVAAGAGVVALLLGAGTWRLATGLRGGAAVAVVLVAAVYGAAIGVEFPPVEPEALYFERVVTSMLPRGF